MAKDEAMSAYDKIFSDTANLLTALFAAAGKPDLADRVRPSTRKPGRTIADSAEDDTAEETLPQE